MQLKLTRTQREAGFSKAIVFCLDARAQLTPEEQANVNRYRLSNQVIYNSEAARRHLDAAQSAHAAGTMSGAMRSLGRLALAAVQLNITVNSLQHGQHIECKSLDELLSAEDALMTACQNLKAYLDTAATFDGREVLIDFSGPEPTTVPAATPLRMLPPASNVDPPTPTAPPATADPPVSTDPLSVDPPAFHAPPPSIAAAPTVEQYSSFTSAQPDFTQRIARFWDTKSPNQKILLVVGAFVLLLIIYRIF